MDIKRSVVVAGVLALGLGGCGGTGRDGGAGTQPVAAADAATGQSDADFAKLVSAVEGAKVPVCQTEEGTPFIAVPQPVETAARAFSYFRYVEGRIYEFGPCQLPSGGRNELRAYRYVDTGTRDQALTDVSRRNMRPTSTFAFGDLYAVEVWSPEPSLDSPAGQVAAQVHRAIARVPNARHHDVTTAASANCPATAPPAGEVVLPAFLYCPGDLTVVAGTEVRWTNQDVAPHTVTATSADVPFDSGMMDTGKAFTFRFDRPGTYEYFCRLHPAMRGTVTVTVA